MNRFLNNIEVVVRYAAKSIYWIYTNLRKLHIVYLYCRYVHKGIRAEDGWLSAPFGIGGGHTIYYLTCSECKRVYWEIGPKEYRELKKGEKTDGQKRKS